MSVVLGAGRNRLGDQGVHVGSTLCRPVINEVQCRHRVNVQALEQAAAQEPGRRIQSLRGFDRITRQQAEEHLGVRVVGVTSTAWIVTMPTRGSLSSRAIRSARSRWIWSATLKARLGVDDFFAGIGQSIVAERFTASGRFP